MCETVLGIHCGKRKKDGYLSIICQDNGLYRCHTTNFEAQFLGICNSCVIYETPGLDYCAVKLKKDS
jgi:hypothetical protein